MKRKKLPEIIVTELLLVKADWHRTLMGQISRETTMEGTAVFHGNADINEGKVWSVAETEEELGKNLDCICKMKLDEDLHGSSGVAEIIAGTSFFLN